MKASLRHARLSAAIIAALSGASMAHADTLQWDSAGSNPPTDGAGQWSATSGAQTWYDTTTGSVVAWTDGNSATFGGGSSATGTSPYTVTLQTPVTVNNLTFGTASGGGYYNLNDLGDGKETLALNGDFIKTAAVGGVVVGNAPTATVTNPVSSAISLSAGNHNFIINDTPGVTPAEVTIYSPITGTGSLTLNDQASINSDPAGTSTPSAFSGYGTLVLNSGGSTYSGGTNIVSGQLIANATGALGTGAISISGTGALSFGGNGSTQASSITIPNAVTISRSNYSTGDGTDYPAAITSNNTGNAADTVTFTGPITVDTANAVISANTSGIAINGNMTNGPDVTAGGVTFTGDYASGISLSGNNTGLTGGMTIAGGVEVTAASQAALGGPGATLNLQGGTIHINSALLTSDPAFATNFGGFTINPAAVGTGVDVDKGLTFTVNGLSGGGVGMRGGGTLNFTGTNTFTGTPYFDGVDDGPNEGTETDTTATGFVNFESGSTSTMPALQVRSATVNVAGTLNVGTSYTSIGVSSTGSNNTPDYGTVDISGTLDATGNDFNVSDNANTHGTINLGYNATAYNASTIVNTGTLTVGGVFYLGKSAGGIGTVNMVSGTTLNPGFQMFIGQNDGTGVFNQSGGTVNLTNNGNFTFVINDGRQGTGAGSGTYNFSGGILNSAGEVYVGEGSHGDNANWNQSNGTANLTNWFVVGREGAWGTVTMTGGTINHSGGGNMSLGDSVSSAGHADIINLSGSAAINDTANDDFIVGNNGAAAQMTESDTASVNVAGQLWLGNGSGGNASLTLSNSASLTVNNWLAVGRNGGTGTLNINGGTVTQANSNYLDIGGDGLTSNGTVNVNAGGTLNAYQMLVGENGNGAAVLNVNGGTVNVPTSVITLANGDSVTGTISLNSGTLTTAGLQAHTGLLGESAGTGAATVNFNGGTLVAAADSTNFISSGVQGVVSTGGAILNTNGHAVTIAAPLSHDSTVTGADGGFTIKGGGTVTLTGASTYTGATNVTSGTLQLGTGAVTTVAPQLQYLFNNASNPYANTGAAGSAYNGTAAGNANTDQSGGKFGGELNLDGSSTVNISDSNNVFNLSPTGNWTFSTWVAGTAGLSNLAGSALVEKDSNGDWSNGDTILYLKSPGSTGGSGTNPGGVRFGGGFVGTNGSGISDTNYHMVTYVDNGGTITIYLDGVAQATVGSSGSPAFTNGSAGNLIQLGNSTDTFGDGALPMDGSESAVNYFNQALTPAQVQQLMASNAITTAIATSNLLPAATPVSLTTAGAGLNVTAQAGNQTIGSLTGVSGTTVTLGGGTLTTGGNNISTTFAGVVSGPGSLTKTGTGTFTLSGSNTYTGLTTVNGGALVLDTNAQSPVLTGGGADVQSGKLVFDYSGGTDPIATVRSLLTASYNAPGGAFSTGQIHSSTAVSGKYGLGYSDDGSSQVTVMYTLYGDANLDGSVNFADLLTVAQNYDRTGTDWAQGDFNYDGSTGFADLLLVAQNYNQSLSSTQVAQLDAVSPDFVQTWNLALSEVPEPASLGLMAMTGAALLSGRRRRRA